MFELPEAHENPLGKIHYIFSYGTSGCIPDTLECFTSKEGAVDFFELLFDYLPENTLKRLSKELDECWCVGMPVTCYASISECDCGEPWAHTDSYPDRYEVQDWLDWLDEEDQ